MITAFTALGLYVVWLVVAFGVRTLVLLRRTGDSGVRGFSGRPGSAAWWAGVLFLVALLAGAGAPVAALAGLDPLPGGESPLLQGTGLVLALLGIVVTVAAQAAMGSSWRVGVDESERTELVTGGPFQLVRNPIFTAMLIAGAGLTLMVPNIVAAAAFATLLLAVELQVRVVEEPYLTRSHGDAYLEYAGSTGRFLPGIGRRRSRREQ